MPSGIVGTNSIKPSDDLYVRLSRDVYNGLKRFGQVYKVPASDTSDKKSYEEKGYYAKRRDYKKRKKHLAQAKETS